MVAGLPLCETNSVRDPFGDATLISVTCRQPFRNLSYSSRLSPNTPDIEPPMIEEVNGIDRTELEYHEWRKSINSTSPPCHCQDVELWESSDSNEGTGDHESFK